MSEKYSEWWICQFENGEYIGLGTDNDGFNRVSGLRNAYLAVKGELDESAEILANGEPYKILKVRVHDKDKITILASNFYK